MSTEQLFFNGIDGETGDYLLPPLTLEQVSKIAQGEEFDPDHLSELNRKNDQLTNPNFAPEEGIDPKDLSQTGWGVIFAFDPRSQGANPQIKAALQELLDHRKNQASKQKETYYRELIYRPGESKPKFLERYGVGPGPADPNKMPYYLLIVGDPETIPYRFQYQLDVQYAVGRIYFETEAEYAQYAHSVVQAETTGLSLSRRASFFGVRNDGDRATRLSADNLIKPLADWMKEDQPNWDVQTLLEAEATKSRLGQLLGGNETPSLLFTASHGMGFKDPNHPKLLSQQGSLICQDWPGPGIPLTEDHYFSAFDVSNEARLLGLIAFHFACYGAGTPKLDDFAHGQNSAERAAIAPHAFVAQLPQRLLGHPQGGALAVIGHVERAWGYSFSWSDIRGTEESQRQLAVFRSTIKRLLEGHPVGSAVEYFNERYAELSSDLTIQLEDIKFGAVVDDRGLAQNWTANNDARSYAIVGDPAVRLMVGENGKERPTIGTINLTSPVTSAPSSEDTAVQKSQKQLTQALEQFLEVLKQNPNEQGGSSRLAVSAATTLLEVLKGHI
jgi:hypothetical protein